jgi:phage baseplate assembly protein W
VTTHTLRFPGYRLAETRRGDTLQDVAARELGDPDRWRDIAALNGLVSPYIVDSLAELEDTPSDSRVLVAGQALKIPAPKRRANEVPADDIYGTDMRLDERGLLAVTGEGDWGTVTGTRNLVQALSNRIETDPGELKWHPTYGCKVRRLIGRRANPGNNLLAAFELRRALTADPRVETAKDVTAEIRGDRIAASGTVLATDGKTLPVAVGDEGE